LTQSLHQIFSQFDSIITWRRHCKRRIW
jgi:hypothetical protein